MHQRSIIAAIGLAAAVLGTVPSTASAKPLDGSGAYTDDFRDDGMRCGRFWQVDVHIEGHVVLRDSVEGAPELLVHDNYTETRHYVGDNGDSWRIVQKNNFLIPRIVQTGATTYEVTFQNTGRNWVLTSESGTAVWADRGIVRFTFAIDTQGDDDSSNDDWEFVDELVRGPHVVGNFDPNDPGSLCPYVDEAIALG